MDGSLELIQSYTKNGDAQAFAAIVREYQGLVYRVCLRIHGNTHQAEDSTQECFLLLARNAGKVKKSLPGWLHRCARPLMTLHILRFREWQTSIWKV